VLGPEQVQSFVSDGFLVVPGLVSPDELEELKGETVKIARGAFPCASIQPLPRDTSDAQALRSFLCIHQPHYISPVMLGYARHPKVCAVLSQITAAHLPWWDGSVKCMQTMVFVKPPGFQGQAWHQDEIYIPTRDRSLVGAWIAIDDASVENGCLWVIPGSHRSGYLYPQRPHHRADEWDVSSESFGFDDAAKVPVQVKAGSVVFFNGYLLHCSFKNRSNIYRRALVSHYMNAYSLLPWRYHKDQPPTAQDDVRAIVPVAGVDPYAWKGLEQPPAGVWLRKCQANQSDAAD
jgi:ectoine hydroxylase-related dioxygenase (phytanoyl-CoA dioxygenase family)